MAGNLPEAWAGETPGRGGEVEILVTGATGAIGRTLSAVLAAQGHEVVAATRHPGRYHGPGRPLGLDLDLDLPGPAPDALAPTCGAAFYLVHAVGHPEVADVDRARAERFARRWGPDRPVVYLGGLGPDDTTSTHLRSRHEVGDVLRERCRTVELRASLVIGADSLSFRLLARLGRLAGCAPLPVLVPRAARVRTQPVALDDVVRTLVGALALRPVTYDVGGPDVVTYAELLERSAAVQGRSLRTAPIVPLDAAWAGPGAALVAGEDPFATTALFEGMATEAVVRAGHELPTALRPATPLDTAIATALGGP